MLIGLLGTLKAGAAYVPLDPSYPAERLAYMLDDSAPIALLTQSTLSERVRATTRLTVLVLDDDSSSSQPVHDPVVDALTPQHLAYVIYTSGSTGQPKGVMVHHQGLVNYLEHASAQYLHDGISGALVATPFGFDATVTTLMTSWLSGKPIVLLPEDSHECLTQLLSYCQQSEPWLFKLTPAHLDALAHLASGPLTSTAHVLVVGGEQLTRRCLVKFRERVLPAAVVINEYGPTENVVGCSTYVSDGRDTHTQGDVVPIGRPIANTQIYLLDASGEPVPVSVAGEMYLGGVQVARGYLNRPQLTADRFVEDRFGAPGARLYKTGDLARWLPDGTLEYLGRNDFQVKIRGFRIELGEIEAKLAACVGVREVVVVAREDIEGDKRLVAYLVAEIGVTLEAVQLRATLSRELAEYMIPSAFVSMEALPLTANGKLDRKALPSPDQTSVASRVYAAPMGEVEQTIAEVWQQLLGLERVSRHDHFFELGGHSLLAISLIERLRQRGLSADVGTVFTMPTLSVLAAKLSAASEPGAAFEVPANLIADRRNQEMDDAQIEEFSI